MPYVSKEQLTAAREVDLLTYLRCFEPQELVHISGSTYATRTHDSLKISNGKWFWWSRGIGGRNALDYLTAVEGLWLPEAVQRILGESPCIPPPPKPAVLYPKTEFTLPPKHADNRRVLHIYAAAALTPRSSTTASSTGSSMRMLSAITAYLLALQRGSLPMPCCGERSGKSGLSVKQQAATSNLPLVYPWHRATDRPCAFLKEPLMHYPI